jgi:hypothetical protein
MLGLPQETPSSLNARHPNTAKIEIENECKRLFLACIMNHSSELLEVLDQ